MHCKYLSKEGKCTGKYSGYACIRKQCPSHIEALKCEFRDVSGDYCRKYARFGCVGKDSCGQLTDYLAAVVEEERAS